MHILVSPMIETCPACGGKLYAEEERTGRRFLRTRRVVRCDGCRSVIRQRGNNRWHYAVDPRPNPHFYEAANGRTFTELELVALLENPPEKPDESAGRVVVIDAENVEISPPLDEAERRLQPGGAPAEAEIVTPEAPAVETAEAAGNIAETGEVGDDGAPRFIEGDDIDDFLGD
ncbi:MAG: hypothetical protein JXB47_03390 [Anaerolineae bacterium]|nr:hypothetical protein [Anaerolineae bacterium]